MDPWVIDSLLPLVRKMVSFKMVIIYPMLNTDSVLNQQVEKMMYFLMTDKVDELKIYLEFLDLREVSIGTVYYEITEYC